MAGDGRGSLVRWLVGRLERVRRVLTSRRVVDVWLVPFCTDIRDIHLTRQLLAEQHPDYPPLQRSSEVAKKSTKENVIFIGLSQLVSKRDSVPLQLGQLVLS